MKIALVLLLTFISISSFGSIKAKSADKVHKKLDSCIFKTLKQRRSDIFFIEKFATIKAEALINSTSLVFMKTQYKKCKLLKKETKFFEVEELKSVLLDLRVLEDEKAISKDLYIYLQDIYAIKRRKNFLSKYYLKPLDPNPIQDSDTSN